MKKIHKYIDHICEELDDAAHYAEKFIIFQTSKPNWGRMYSEMAANELAHAEYIKTMGQEFIDGLEWASENSREAWEHCMGKYAEKSALVKLMLSK